MAKMDLAGAVGFVAGTDNDTTNLSLVAGARESTRSCSSPHGRTSSPVHRCSRR